MPGLTGLPDADPGRGFFSVVVLTGGFAIPPPSAGALRGGATPHCGLLSAATFPPVGSFLGVFEEVEEGGVVLKFFELSRRFGTVGVSSTAPLEVAVFAAGRELAGRIAFRVSSATLLGGDTHTRIIIQTQHHELFAQHLCYPVNMVLGRYETH